MKLNYILLFFSGLAILSACNTNKHFEQQVRLAVERQMKLYPESDLQDIYKNFFQDKFGPGHLIADTAAARNYLNRELSEFIGDSNPLLEKTGWEGNFYRVNLSVLKDNIIPIDTFFTAFIESANSVNPPNINEWHKEWNKITSIIHSMQLNLPGFEQQTAEIEKMLTEGNYVTHHSQHFIDCYQPHYRIVSKIVFQKRLSNYMSAIQPLQ